MLAYFDVALGMVGVFAWFWIFTSYPWHHWAHQDHDGIFFRGRLICRHCHHESVREIEHTTKDAWREELIDKIRGII